MSGSRGRVNRRGACGTGIVQCPSPFLFCRVDGGSVLRELGIEGSASPDKLWTAPAPTSMYVGLHRTVNAAPLGLVITVGYFMSVRAGSADIANGFAAACLVAEFIALHAAYGLFCRFLSNDPLVQDVNIL